MAVIVKRLFAYEVSDSNGNPTIEVELGLSSGVKVAASVGTDNIINTFGKKELRDNDMGHYAGMGVKKAISIINADLGPKLLTIDTSNQSAVDGFIKNCDGTQDYSKIGVNTACVLSKAFAKSGAVIRNLPLYKHLNDAYTFSTKGKIQLEKIPTPIIGILAGGDHVEIREFSLLPTSAMSFAQAYEMIVDVYHSIRPVLEQLSISYSKSFFGEYVPNRSTNQEMIDVIFDVLQRKSLKLGKHVFFGMNIAGNGFFRGGKYSVKDRPSSLSTNEFYDFIVELINRYSIFVIEDPFATGDEDGWRKLFVNYGEQIYICAHTYAGDKMEYVQSGDPNKHFTTYVFKPGYFGTITETFEQVAKLRAAGHSYIIAAEKHDTGDDFLADFAMAVQPDYIKFGAPVNGERVAKYNRLLKIEQLARARTPGAAEKPAGGVATAAASTGHATPLPPQLLNQK
jgi:enolase